MPCGQGGGSCCYCPSLPPSDWMEEENCVQLKSALSWLGSSHCLLWTFVGRGVRKAKRWAELKMFLSFIFAPKSLGLKKSYGKVRKSQAVENHKFFVRPIS